MLSFWGEKKLSSWWKTQMSIYMADQPCIDMHKCSFHWGSEGEGKHAAISSLSMSMSNCFDVLFSLCTRKKERCKNVHTFQQDEF